MRFLVTGGAGFIGSAVVRHLVGKTPHEVAVVDKLTYAGSLQALSSVSDDSRFRFFRGDVADAASMGDLVETVSPDVIMHLAAETHVDRSIDDSSPFMTTNVIGTSVLLDVARHYWNGLPAQRRERFRFHHISTDEVFGAIDSEDGQPFTEESSYKPSSPYAASKAASDHLVRAWYRTYGLPVVLTNCSNNYGPFQFPEKLIPLTIANCLGHRPLPVYGRGENVRDWLYVEDHVEALVLVSERGKLGETYNVGGGWELRNIDVVKMICETVDALSPSERPSHERISFVKNRPGHDFRYAMDASKIRNELGWAPRETFATGLEKTVRWFLDNRDWMKNASASYDGRRLGLGR